MAVTCAKCGEELLGAVNRCWKCGQEVLSTPDAGRLPAVRRAPPAEISPGAQTDHEEAPNETAAESSANAADQGDIFLASVVDENSPATPADAPAAGKADAPSAPEILFESGSAPAQTPPAHDPTRPHAPPSAHQQRGLSEAAAFAAVVFGILAIALGGLYSWALIFAVIGVAVGLGSVGSRRRGIAILGLALCLLGLTVSSVRLAYDTFIFLYGQPPIAAQPVDGDEELPLDAAEPPPY